MSGAKTIWEHGKRISKASFSIPYIGELSLQVEAELPGAGGRLTAEEQKELVLRHARLLVRNFVNLLDRESV